MGNFCFCVCNGLLKAITYSEIKCIKQALKIIKQSGNIILFSSMSLRSK